MRYVGQEVKAQTVKLLMDFLTNFKDFLRKITRENKLWRYLRKRNDEILSEMSSYEKLSDSVDSKFAEEFVNNWNKLNELYVKVYILGAQFFVITG